VALGARKDRCNPWMGRTSQSCLPGGRPVGGLVTLTLNLSSAVTVAGGTPTLTLNDGGTRRRQRCRSHRRGDQSGRDAADRYHGADRGVGGGASGTGITAGFGDLGVGSVVTLTLNLNSAVTVAGGTPTLTLNDGGTATYACGSGSNALTFSYTVGAGQNTSDLAVKAINLGAARPSRTAPTTPPI
jgi:hypothetical protein